MSEAENTRASIELQAAEIARLQEQQQMKEIAPADKTVVRSYSRPEVSVHISPIVFGIGEQMFVP